MKLLTVIDLSNVIRKSPSTIRSTASRSPLSLPPICRLPGSKRLLWRDADVQKWIDSHVKDELRDKVESVNEDIATNVKAVAPPNPKR